MSIMEEILQEQRTIAHSLSRALDNAKKLGKFRLTIGVAQGRLTVFQEAWSRYRAQDGKLHSLANDADKATHAYFVKEEVDVVEEHYLAACDYLHDRIAVLANPLAGSSTQVGDVSMTSRQSIQIKLPHIESPTFAGEYASWESYHNLFESLIVNNDTLSNTQRLHYLKASLTGEAGNLLKHVSITEQNYHSAWDSLKARYDNQRVIIHAHLTALVNIPSVGANIIQDLKRLRDTTAQSIAALRNLKRPVDQWDDLLVYLTAERLDSKSRSDWELSLGAGTNYSTYVELDEFVKSRIRALESIASSNQTAGSNQKSCPTTIGRLRSTRSHVTTNTNTNKCVLCGGQHQLYKCPQFVKQTVDQRRQIARDHRCCFNCLWIGHMPKQCPSKHTCSVCQKNHNTMLHMSVNPSVSAEATTSRDSNAQSAVPSEQRPSTSVATHVAQGLSWQLNYPVLLATAWVTVQAPNGRSLQVRALVDQGSESSFVSESVAQTLHLSRQSMNTNVTGIGGSTVTTVRSKTSFTIKSQYGARPSVTVSALVLPRLSSYAPPRMTGFNSWTHLHNLDLADPFLDNNVPIGLLIGSDLYGVILLDGVRKGFPGAPIAQNTIFGWILSGSISASRDGAAPTIAVHHCTMSEDLDVLVRKFWEVESIFKPTPLTEEDQRCEEHFLATHQRKSDGRYQVRIPFKSSFPLEIGNSLNKADACLAHLERRFTRDASISSMYHDFLDEYETLGHMAPMSSTTLSTDNTILYIPHHPVMKDSSSTTRLRVVFNASSPTTNGTSLNDHMFTGQKLQRDLSDIIVNWRSHKYVYTADIAKMYRQILVDPRDTQYQCIRWRRSPDQDILTFKLLTVTYGTAAAPYLALRVLSQLSVDEGDAFSQAQTVLNENFYVDDVLFGADSLESAQEIREQLITLLKKGGFHLRKWTSNHRDLLAHIPVADQEQTVNHPMQEMEGVKVLGLLWKPELDAFSFHVTIPQLNRIIKRTVLSFIARLFDPLGRMAPIVITAKIIMRKLWVQQLEWDSTLPLDLRTKWLTYCESMSLLMWLRQLHCLGP